MTGPAKLPRGASHLGEWPQRAGHVAAPAKEFPPLPASGTLLVALSHGPLWTKLRRFRPGQKRPFLATLLWPEAFVQTDHPLCRDSSVRCTCTRIVRGCGIIDREGGFRKFAAGMNDISALGKVGLPKL